MTPSRRRQTSTRPGFPGPVREATGRGARRPPRLLGAVLAVAAAGALGACTLDDDSGVTVVTGFYPLQYVAERVGGEHVSVTNLTPPGAEPHDLELSPVQMGRLSSADLVLHLDGFQPEVDEAVAQNNPDHGLDIAEVTPLLPTGAHEQDGEDDGDQGRLDPHVWLDPTRLTTITDAVADRLAEVDPANAADYRANADALGADLATLDAEFQDGLATCARREIVTSHAAFGYLADRYDLTQVGLTGLTPETEPSPQRLAEATREAREYGATTIFFEALVSPKLAETIAAEVGATTAVLDPLEGVAGGSGDDYLSVMRDNLAALRTALDCR